MNIPTAGRTGSTHRAPNTSPCGRASDCSISRVSRKFLVQGPDALAVLNRIGTAEHDVPPGRVVYTQWLNERGGIEADLTVTRLGRARIPRRHRRRDAGA